MKYWTKEWYRNPEETPVMPDGSEYEETVSLLPPFYAADFVMHGCVLNEWHENGDALALKFDASDSYSAINEVRLTGAELIECECGKTERVTWLYDEIYREDGKFVLHILFGGENGELYYVTVRFDTIAVGYDEKKKHEEDTFLGMLSFGEKTE